MNNGWSFEGQGFGSFMPDIYVHFMNGNGICLC
jgi:hypothetical protein